VIDAHHHLWDPAARRMPWLAGDQPWASAEELAPLRRAFTLDDLEPLAAAAGVTGTVAVQTLDDAAETADLLALAGGLVLGVVGWVDLTADDVGDQVAALRALPGGSALCGIRHPLLGDPDASWLARDEVRRGLRELGAGGPGEALSFDLVLRANQLAGAVATTRFVNEVEFVLDHLGYPPVGEPDNGAWAAAIRDLATLGNVSGKLSGAHSEPGEGSAAALRPFYETVLDAFGPERLMFGSDWPVSSLTAPYGEISGMYRELIGELSPAEQDAILDGTARRVYRLNREKF
jgi:L-fuconolactonase